jgi:hypothetical protein
VRSRGRECGTAVGSELVQVEHHLAPYRVHLGQRSSTDRGLPVFGACLPATLAAAAPKANGHKHRKLLLLCPMHL